MRIVLDKTAEGGEMKGAVRMSTAIDRRGPREKKK